MKGRRKPRVLSREDLGEVMEAAGWGELVRSDGDIAEAIAIDRMSKIVNARKIVVSPPEGWCWKCNRTWRTGPTTRRAYCTRCHSDENTIIVASARPVL